MNFVANSIFECLLCTRHGVLEPLWKAEINQVEGVPCKVPVAERKGSGCQNREGGPAAGAESAPAASDRRLVMWAGARPPHALRTELSLRERGWKLLSVCCLQTCCLSATD